MNTDNLILLYNAYDNRALLDIVKNAADYRPEAVELARKILAERGIDVNDPAAFIIEISQPEEEKEVFKNLPMPGWAPLLFIVIFLYSGYVLVSGITEINAVFRSNYRYEKMHLAWEFFIVIYIVLAAVLLFFEKKQGWIMAFAFMLSQFIGVLLSLVLPFVYRVYADEYTGIYVTVLVVGVVAVFSCYGLTRKLVMNNFKAGRRASDIAIVVAVVLGLFRILGN